MYFLHERFASQVSFKVYHNTNAMTHTEVLKETKFQRRGRKFVIGIFSYLEKAISLKMIVQFGVYTCNEMNQSITERLVHFCI